MKGVSCMNIIINWIRKIIEFFKILYLIYKYGLDAILKDPLTGVYTMFLLKEFGEIEIKRAERYGFSLCVVMFDLDNLKEINDRQGHDAGDKAIIRVVNVFQKNFYRATDIFFRVGGDEFLILLVKTSESGVEQLLQRVAKELDDLFLFASTGTCFWKKNMTLKELRKGVDTDLYKNKKEKKKKPEKI